jgi:hypothetical protein
MARTNLNYTVFVYPSELADSLGVTQLLTVRGELTDDAERPARPSFVVSAKSRSAGLLFVTYHQALSDAPEPEARAGQWVRIDPAARLAVETLLHRDPGLLPLWQELARHAHSLWKESARADWHMRVTVDPPPGDPLVVVAVPATANPEDDAQRLWTLCAWLSVRDPDRVAEQHFVLTVEYEC